MKLRVGERLTTSNGEQPGGYVVTGVVRETPWHGLYTGKKIFYNFDFTSKRPRETDEREWLDVFLRTVEYPVRDDPAYVAARRAQAHAEAQRVLGSRCSNLWPEPVDLLEIANTRDPFGFTASETEVSLQEPVVIFAHPHGQSLAEWQRSVLPLTSLRAILAELLAFMEQAHKSGLVLNGLSPQTVLIDRAERVHYVGTDMVFVEGEAPAPDAWLRLFPPQRYTAGFAPPECVEEDGLPDRRSDLYAWGAVAFSLLTGERLDELAQLREGMWIRFQDHHFAALERALRGIPPAQVRHWAEQLGVTAAGFGENWPANALAAFRLLLHPERRRRPASVAELRAWLATPPPFPVAAVLALRAGPEQVRIFVDLSGLPPELEMTIRRGPSPGPNQAHDGEPVYDGPRAAEVGTHQSASDRLSYSVFTKKRGAGHSLFSAPVQAEVLTPRSSDLLKSIEKLVAPDDLEQAEPPLVSLLVRAVGELEAAAFLLTSNIPAVRALALQRIVARSYGPGGADAERLLWTALADPIPTLRLQAAGGILRNPAQADPDLVRRLARALGGEDLDERIQAAYSLDKLGVAHELIQRTVQALEGERPTTCPVCQTELAGRDRPAHLRDVHGFVDVFGVLLPRQVALERLWERILVRGDSKAHQRLLEILYASATGEDAGRPYVAALESELSGRPDLLPDLPERLGACWQGAPELQQVVPALLRTRNDAVREAGRTILLRDIAAKLGNEKTSSTELRHQLDRFCPEDLLEEKIIFCLRLPKLGIDLEAANTCLAKLQEERPITCTECRGRVKLCELETHLRRAHGILEFRGVRRSFRDMRAHLVNAVCGSSPDPAAWSMLATLARERHGENTEERLILWLAQGLRSLKRSRRHQGVNALAEVIAADEGGPRLLERLPGPTPAGTQGLRRWLALEVVRRLPPPLHASVIDKLHPLLNDKQIPRDTRQGAVAALLRTLGKAGRQAELILAAYVAGWGKIRAIEKLHLLEQYVGKAPAIDAVCATLEDQVRMNCPRCATQLRRAQMVAHLWDRHRLVLEGRRVRDPWRMIEDWLEDYRLERDAALLERCRDLAVKMDPEEGTRRLQRLLLRHGVEDREALAALLEQARHDHACLCPHCYQQIPVRETSLPPPLTFRDNHFEGQGHYIEISENGLWPRVYIEGPDGPLHEGREPGSFLTRSGALAFVVAPLVLLCFLVTELLTGQRLPLILEVLLAIGVGLFVGGMMYLFWPTGVNLRDRAVNAAWTLLIAGREEETLSPADAALVAALARASAGWGDPSVRSESLEQVCPELDKLARGDANFVPHLAVIWRLRSEDLIRQEEDPLELLAAQVDRCFNAKLPFDYAAHLLKGLNPEHQGADALWTKGLMHRLSIMLCDRAFAAGLELCDLSDLAQAYPEMRWLLGVDDINHLARLRLLWSMRLEKPWDRCGAAVTAFELAATSSGARLLARFPDLLLASEGMALYVCSRGVSFEDVWFDDMPDAIAVRPNQARGGYELIVGPHHFRYEITADALAGRLEKWFRYYFREFVPQVPAVHTWRDPDVVAHLQARNGVACPTCKKKVLLRPGAVGVTLDEKAAASWV